MRSRRQHLTDIKRIEDALRAADFDMSLRNPDAFPLALDERDWTVYAVFISAHHNAQEPEPMQQPSPDNLLRDVTPFLNDLAYATRELAEAVGNVSHPEDRDAWIQPDWITPLPKPQDVAAHLSEIETALRGIAATWGIPIVIDTEDEAEDKA